MARLDRAVPHARKMLLIIEPQPTFRASLTQLAASINATFLPVAAAKRDGTASFHIDKPGSKGASLARQHEGEMQTRTLPVPTIDLAAFFGTHAL